MKLIAIVLGLALLGVAAAYFLVPAGSLPDFVPGFEAARIASTASTGSPRWLPRW